MNNNIDSFKPYTEPSQAVENSLHVYSEFAQDNFMPKVVSLEDLEEKIEQAAREEEADSIVLADEKRLTD